jgi:hypothetical protein
VQHHQAETGNYRSDDQSLETAVSRCRHRRAGYQRSRAAGFGTHSEAAGADSLGHSQKSEGQFHALELSQTGCRAGYQRGSCVSRLERGGSEAASLGGVHGQRRSQFRTKAADIIGLYLTRPSMRRSSMWMRRPPFRLYAGLILFCRFRTAAPSATGSSTTGMASCHSMPRWNRQAAGFTEKPQPVTRAGNSLLS